jgi:hypothetical protein
MASACATVDMTEVAISKPQSVSKSSDVNVVQRAANKLYTAFKNKGFVAETSRSKVRAAALTLLKGLQKSPLSAQDNYASSVGSWDALKSDIILAKGHVEQTRQAAEIYLAMAPGDNSLGNELSSLEKALMAANEAKRSFTAAEDIFNAPEGDALLGDYSESLEGLRRVTDAFGQRVRNDAMNEAKAINS